MNGSEEDMRREADLCQSGVYHKPPPHQLDWLIIICAKQAFVDQ